MSFTSAKDSKKTPPKKKVVVQPKTTPEKRSNDGPVKRTITKKK